MPGTQAARAAEGSAVPYHSHPRHWADVLLTASEPHALAQLPLFSLLGEQATKDASYQLCDHPHSEQGALNSGDTACSQAADSERLPGEQALL